MLTVFQYAAIAVGAFYVFVGVVVLRAMVLDRVMDQLLVALNEPSAPKERLRSRVLTLGAVLTMAGGIGLMLLSPLATPVFLANALWQGGYLLWAEKAAARGRERSSRPEADQECVRRLPSCKCLRRLARSTGIVAAVGCACCHACTRRRSDVRGDRRQLGGHSRAESVGESDGAAGWQEGA